MATFCNGKRWMITTQVVRFPAADGIAGEALPAVIIFLTLKKGGFHHVVKKTAGLAHRGLDESF